MNYTRIKGITALILALLTALTCFTACGEVAEYLLEPEEYEYYEEEEYSEPEAPQAEPEVIAPSQTFESNDGLVTRLNVVQVMASGLDANTGELYDITQLVAGKNSLIYAEFAEPVYVEQDGSMVLTIEKDGAVVSELLPSGSGESQSAYFIPRNIADVNNWEPGTYSITLTYGESTASRQAEFMQAKSIKVLAVPVLANYAGRVVACEGEWKTAIEFTRDCYPVAYDGIEYVLGSEVDLSDDYYDLTTDDGMYNVWEALASLQTPNNEYELILGFVRERQGDGYTQGYTYGLPANIITESDGDMQPTVAHEIAHCYNVGDEYTGGAINNRINPAPYGMEGSDWVERDSTVAGNKQAVQSAWVENNENSGSLVLTQQVPINVNNLSSLEHVGSFMGSGSMDVEDYWITSDIWSQLYKAFVFGDSSYPDEYVSPSEGLVLGADNSSSNETESSGDGSMLMCPVCGVESEYDAFEMYGYCPDCDDFTELDKYNAPESFICDYCATEIEVTNDSAYMWCPDASCGYLASFSEYLSIMEKNNKAVAKTALEQEVTAIDIMGKLNADDTFEKTPWYAYDAYASDIVLPEDSDYAVVMRDAGGAELSRQSIEVSFYTKTNPPKKNDFAAVNSTVVLTSGAAEIAIVKGEVEIYTEKVSENMPTAEFVGIDEYDSFSGKKKVKWNASDADGDELSFELWYCAAEGDYYSVATNIVGNSYTVDFDALPGSDAGYLYLYTTDGINTSGIDSPWIKVGYKAPEVVSADPEKTEYALTDEIMYTCDVYDIQDGWLYTAEQMAWYYDGREYMTGDTLWVYPFELTPGEHSFTAVATNSAGESVEKEYTFTVTDDESALPDDWSKEDVKAALSNGFVAPLNNVDASITRGRFASLMSNLYWSVFEEGSPDPEYAEGVVTDCGADDYDQYLMVALGLMEAPEGRFNPTGTLTEQEAAMIMYNICAIADPNVADPVDDSAEAASICIECGVMDESGDNVYTEASPITGRLALVRCNRLYNVIFVTE